MSSGYFERRAKFAWWPALGLLVDVLTLVVCAAGVGLVFGGLQRRTFG